MNRPLPYTLGDASIQIIFGIGFQYIGPENPSDILFDKLETAGRALKIFIHDARRFAPYG